ncbi:MAG: zinc ribbon domain-containing protein [Candidatus Stahlbacteria bacterium]|nr:zinc ribbon domain-containing protein [Candidatus Stahlbacteria bacterium]
MPTYEFKCNSCNERFEVCVSISERTKVKCQKCNSREVVQLLSGFYVIGTEQGKGGGASSCTACSRPSCSSCNH